MGLLSGAKKFWGELGTPYVDAKNAKEVTFRAKDQLYRDIQRIGVRKQKLKRSIGRMSALAEDYIRAGDRNEAKPYALQVKIGEKKLQALEKYERTLVGVQTNIDAIGETDTDKLEFKDILKWQQYCIQHLKAKQGYEDETQKLKEQEGEILKLVEEEEAVKRGLERDYLSISEDTDSEVNKYLDGLATKVQEEERQTKTLESRIEAQKEQIIRGA